MVHAPTNISFRIAPFACAHRSQVHRSMRTVDVAKIISSRMNTWKSAGATGGCRCDRRDNLHVYRSHARTVRMCTGQCAPSTHRKLYRLERTDGNTSARPDGADASILTTMVHEAARVQMRTGEPAPFWTIPSAPLHTQASGLAPGCCRKTSPKHPGPKGHPGARDSNGRGFRVMFILLSGARLCA